MRVEMKKNHACTITISKYNSTFIVHFSIPLTCMESGETCDGELDELPKMALLIMHDGNDVGNHSDY